MKDLNAPISAKGPSDGLMFRILVIIALLVLFGLFLYAIFGPLPNQKNFITTNPNSANGVFPQLTVAGTSTLDGNVEAKSLLKVDGSTTMHDLNFITTSGNIDTTQGKIIPSSNNIDIRSVGNIRMTNMNGGTVSAIFNSNGTTNFMGDLNMNGSILDLINLTDISKQYLISNDSSTSDLIIKAKDGPTIKNIFNAKVVGNQLNLLKDSTDPLLYIGTGNGRVYDTVYNQPTYTTTPTFTTVTTGTLNVTGNTTLGGILGVTGNTTVGGTLDVNDVLTSNGNLNINTIGGAGLNIKNGSTTLTRIANGNITLNDSDAYIDFSDNTTGKNHYISFGGTNQRLIAFNNGGMYAQDDLNFVAQNQSGTSGIGKFDTRVVGTGTGQRNPFSEPFLNLTNYGSLKFSLPTPGVNPITTFQENYYEYISSDATFKNGNTFPNGTYLGNWFSTQVGANGRLIASGSLPNAIWVCPKKGIWQVEFTAFMGSSFGIGKSSGQCFGATYVSTFSLIDIGENILVAATYGTSLIGAGSKMKFTLIAELN